VNGAHFIAFDGNGNPSALVKGSDGSTSARYEYGPFGEAIRATGPMAKANPFRFSTKYQDDETDLFYYGYRYYNAQIGRWVNRDPISEFVFLSDYVKRNPQLDKKLVRQSVMPQYLFISNDPSDGIDGLGLWPWSDPDVSWAPPPCPRGQRTAFIQIVVGYKGSRAPHVDNGSLGPMSDPSSACPLYPLPSDTSGVFQDTPSGWTGDVQFIVCRVCLAPCCFLKRGVKGNMIYSGWAIASVGPCVYWKGGDKGDLSSDNFTHVDTPNQNWQVGMDTDFPDAAKGGCFKCAR
jgi:RHS repeat-associated protein